jgi:hypothetical protein
MVRWGELRRVQPELADAGRRLLYQFGVGLAFLATVRRDGGPRVHPICPLLADDALVAFLVPSPKRDDLHRDGRYAMHCFPPADNEDAFYITGTAWMVDDARARERLEAQFVAERGWESSSLSFDDQELFEFGIERCLQTSTTGHGDPSPQHVSWRVL